MLVIVKILAWRPSSERPLYLSKNRQEIASRFWFFWLPLGGSILDQNALICSPGGRCFSYLYLSESCVLPVQNNEYGGSGRDPKKQ